jgi:hypothetical protein
MKEILLNYCVLVCIPSICFPIFDFCLLVEWSFWFNDFRFLNLIFLIFLVLVLTGYFSYSMVWVLFISLHILVNSLLSSTRWTKITTTFSTDISTSFPFFASFLVYVFIFFLIHLHSHLFIRKSCYTELLLKVLLKIFVVFYLFISILTLRRLSFCLFEIPSHP